MFELIKFVNEAKKLIKNKKIDEFGYLLNESWKLKKSLSNKISNDKIDHLYNEGLKQGALGGKLLGAGGGGFFLLYLFINCSDNLNFSISTPIIIFS